MPPIMHSYVDGLPDADTEIRYIDIDLNEGYVFHIFFANDSIYNSVDYIEIWVPIMFYNSPIHVARTLVKEVTDYIASKTRILKNMKDPVTGGEPVAFGVGYDKDSSVIRFFSQLPTSFCGMVMYKSTDELLRLLGFPTPTVPVLLQQIPFATASTRPQLKFNTPALYVYSDIVGDELVGDVKVPLLRAVPIDGDMGDFVHKEFIRPYYKSLTKGYINSILIEVKDDTGQDIDFTLGKVICTLHFRRCGLAV